VQHEGERIESARRRANLHQQCEQHDFGRQGIEKAYGPEKHPRDQHDEQTERDHPRVGEHQGERRQSPVEDASRGIVALAQLGTDNRVVGLTTSEALDNRPIACRVRPLFRRRRAVPGKRTPNAPHEQHGEANQDDTRAVPGERFVFDHDRNLIIGSPEKS